MSTRYGIQFRESSSPITQTVTKFGGQPIWLEQPQWPLSRATGNTMRFISQMCVPESMLPDRRPRVAYVFMTDEDEYVDGTWEPDGGENGVVLQPDGGPLPVEVAPVAEGPTLYRMIQTPQATRLSPETCEFAVSLTQADEPEFVSEEEHMSKFSESELSAYFRALEGNKVGGTPLFVQGDEFPAGGPWRLLLQLDSTRVPFSINFGDAGVGYVFLSKDAKQGRLLWQCA